MEQTFFEKLKRVKPGDLLHIIKFILAFPIAMIYRLFRRDLWLLCDTENECRDNGFWLYKYLRENTDEDAVYAINKKSPDYARVKKLGPVIQYGSFRHWIYYLTASKNISSQKMGKPNAAICYVLEVYGILRNKRAFLQHGIISCIIHIQKCGFLLPAPMMSGNMLMINMVIRKVMYRSLVCAALISFMICR